MISDSHGSPRALERGDDAGAHERRLADAGAADHGQERLVADPASTIAAISRLRPKNLPASVSWNDARPAYGFSSSWSSSVRRPGRNGSSAASSSAALGQRCSLGLSRQRSTMWISSRGTSGGAASRHRRHRQLEHRGDDELVAVERVQRVAARRSCGTAGRRTPRCRSGDRSRSRCPTARGTCTCSVPMIVPARVRLVFEPVASSSGLGMRIWPGTSTRAAAPPPGVSCSTLAMPKSSTLIGAGVRSRRCCRA